MAAQGQIFVISGPPGAGKSSLVKMLLERVDNLFYSVSLTTRDPRHNERHGVDYFFINRDDFEGRIAAGEMLEYVEVFNHLYGTSAKELMAMLQAGKDVLLDIEVKGGSRLRQLIPQGVFIFLLPPDLTTLRQRLAARGTESEAMIKNRLSRLNFELSQIEEHYDYLVVNQELDVAYAQIKGIINTMRLSVKRQWPRLRWLWTSHE